jgi:hypothetical protein
LAVVPDLTTTGLVRNQDQIELTDPANGGLCFDRLSFALLFLPLNPSTPSALQVVLYSEVCSSRCSIETTASIQSARYILESVQPRSQEKRQKQHLVSSYPANCHESRCDCRKSHFVSPVKSAKLGKLPERTTVIER